MGWKRVKEHYGIVHIVQVTEKGICIGSGYIHDLIVVSVDGEIIRTDIGLRNGDLARYEAEMSADRQKLRELIAEPDEFVSSLPVYTYRGAEIVELQCEEYGWPNVTHDGQIMYENTFSADRNQVVQWAKSNCAAGVKFARECVSDCRSRLSSAETHLAELVADAVKLGIEVPA